MRFSVVIVNYDSWSHTVRCIDSLLATSREDLQILVVDNEGATTPELHYDITLIQNPANEGFARACNQGIETSDGDCVILINPDTRVKRDFFELLEEFFVAEPKAGIAGPRIVDDDGNLQLSARKEVSFVSGFLGRTSLLTRLFPRSAAIRRMFPAADVSSGSREVDWISGACLVARSRVLDEIGGLDERFFMYFEDTDLCRRSRDAGYPVYYLPQVEVIHLTGASSNNKFRTVWRLHKSAFLYHRKYGPHGPLNLYSVLVLLGLCARGLVKLLVVSKAKPKD